ncbi:MAG: hypothetical protein ACYCOU_19695 [Sulfobacillus sp.]
MSRHHQSRRPKYLVSVDDRPKRHWMKSVLAIFTALIFLFLMFGGILQVFIH